LAEDSGEKYAENVLTKTFLLWRYNITRNGERILKENLHNTEEKNKPL